MMMMRYFYSTILVVAFAAASLFDTIPKISAETVPVAIIDYDNDSNETNYDNYDVDVDVDVDYDSYNNSDPNTSTTTTDSTATDSTPTDSTPTDSPTYSPTTLLSSTIDRFEIRVVGEEGGKPLGQITSLDPVFSGLGFFEAHPSQFEDEGGINSAITIELFTTLKNVPETEMASRSCHQGVLLESIPETGFLIETEAYEFPNYNEVFAESEGDGLYPTTMNGKVGAAKYSISEFTSSKQPIYFPGNGDGTKIEYCLRISLKLDLTGDGEKNYVSYLDSFHTVNVSLEGTFEEQEVVQTSAEQRKGSLNMIADP